MNLFCYIARLTKDIVNSFIVFFFYIYSLSFSYISQTKLLPFCNHNGTLVFKIDEK